MGLGGVTRFVHPQHSPGTPSVYLIHLKCVVYIPLTVPLPPFDCPQARKLRVELHKLIQAHRGMFGEPLFVTSPLTRAIQTTLNMIPYQEELKAGQVNLAVCE